MRIILVLLVLLLTASAAQAVLFDDGLMHVIDLTNSIPNDRFIVEDSAAGDPTSLTITDADVGTFFCGDCSHTSSVRDTSTLTMSGATFGYSLSIQDAATAHISDSFVPSVNATGSSHVTITSGHFGQFPVFTPGDGTDFAVEFHGTSTGEILDGVFDAWVYAWEASILTIHDGLFRDLVVAEENSLLTIYGGVFEDTLNGSQMGVEVFGGSFLGQLVASPTTQITLYGTEFNFPAGDISVSTGTLIGTLLDGSPIDTTFARSGTITLVTIPEPGTAILLSTGLLILSMSKRRSHVHSG